MGSDHRTCLLKKSWAEQPGMFSQAVPQRLWEPWANFWILILRDSWRQGLVPRDASSWRWALGLPKCRSTGFLGGGRLAKWSQHWPVVPSVTYPAGRYGTAPGPSCTLIKQWKSIKDSTSLAGWFFWVPGEASSWLAVGQEKGGLQALPSPCLKSTASALQPGFWPDAN